MCNCYSEESIPESNNKVWRPDDKVQATAARPGSTEIYRPDILETIEEKIKELDLELRELSLDIHGKLPSSSNLQELEIALLQPIQNWATKNSEDTYHLQSSSERRSLTFRRLAMPMMYIRRSWRSMDSRSRNSSTFQQHGRPPSPMALVAGPSG